MKGPQMNDDLGYNGFNVSLFYLAPIQFEDIQDPNVAIALKNITKKNAVTKEKRLGEFLKLLENKSFDVSDYYVLVCWIQSYPRLALDSSKPVRFLAHQVQATYMEQYGAKEFSPYLKSSLPIWLQGLYDDKSIAVSVKNNLLRNFTNDETKVNSKIWIVFHEQIVNYCHHILVQQSANTISDERSDSEDELNLKYVRAIVSAVSMLSKVLELANTSGYFLCETAQEKIEEILKSEKLWDHLESFSNKKTLNLSLFRALLVLITEIFDLDKSQDLKSVSSHLGDLKGIYKVISKKFIKLVKVSESSQSSPSVIYTSVVIQLINVLTILTQFTAKTNSVDKKKYKLKKNFWQIGGSKSSSRLNEYIKLGPCNSDPLYYKYLADLFVALKNSEVSPEEDFSFLDFSNVKDAHKLIEKYLLPQFSKFLGPSSMRYKEEAIKCFLHVHKLFEEQADLSNEGINYNLFFSILDGVASSRIRPEDKDRAKACFESLAHFAKAQSLDTRGISESLVQSEDNKIEGQNYSVVLKTPKDQILSSYHLVLTYIDEKTSEELLSVIFEKLEETCEANTLSALTTCLVRVLQTSKDGDRIIEWALKSLPGFITGDFVDVPIMLIQSVLEQSKSKDLQEFCSDCFTKISSESPQKLPKFLGLVFQHEVFDPKSIEASSPEIYEYLLSLAKTGERSDPENDLVLHFVNNPHILECVVASNPGDSEKQKLVSTFVSRGEALEGEAIGEFVRFAVSSCDETCKKFLDLVKDRSLVQNALFDAISTPHASSGLSKLASYVLETENDLLFSKIEQELSAAYDHMDMSSLAVANPLGQNIYLFAHPQQVKIYSSILPIRSFLSEYLRFSESKDPKVNPKHLLWFAQSHEYSQDAEFLSESGTVSELSKSVRDSYHSGFFTQVVGESTLCEVFNGKLEDGLYGEIVADIKGKGPFKPNQFYSAKVLIHVLSDSFEKMSLASFDKLDIQYTKLAGNPLMLATFLCCASKFVGYSSKLDRVRNYVFGEILGIRSTSDILQSGMTWVALATNFLNDVKYDILSSHKMSMVINQISGWLDSEIAFDDDFANMRVVLSQFLARSISVMGKDIPDKTWSISAYLCSDNFTISQVKPDSQALKYFTLKLFVILSNLVDENIFSLWEINQVTLYEEIFELLHQEQKVLNQPVCLVNELLGRILRSAHFPNQFLTENANRLYGILSSSKLENLQRTAASLLSKQIYASQQDAIVEYQFRNNKDEENDQGEVDKLVKLPPSLLTDIRDLEHHLDDYILHEKYAEAFKYLWSWMLIFAYFEDSTVSMKAAYVEQIKKDDAIEKLLGTVFDCIDLTDSKFLNTLVISPIDKNAKVVPENCLIHQYQVSKGLAGSSAKDEILFLLCHLYYFSFRFLGSFAQQWFQDLRDLQFKQQIQKFSVNYISPILISKMLDDVEKTKDKLTQGDDNFTIKVNRVTNEIKSSYIIDEQNMEMVVKVPEAFPLMKVSVEGPLRLGVKEKQWKAWLMASQRVISLTNGSITDCIELFNKNVNLHFSGFEECAICYSILHQDHSLPSKVCPTCSNKFHSGCLYKWFKSSGSSTCPLCRCTFNFKPTRS